MAHALIFDSGVGGLTVSAEIRKRLPDLQQTYVADDDFRPYGDKSDTELKARLPGLLWTLCEATQVDLAVIACNTASTSVLQDIRLALNIPVIGVVPAVKPAAGLTQTGRFAVLGTPGTIRREYVNNLIQEFATDKEVVLHGSTQLVALAEDKMAGRLVDMKALTQAVQPLFIQPDVDTVVLACTHFPLLKEELSAASPPDIHWIDSGEAIARRVETVVSRIKTTKLARSGPDIMLLLGPDDDPTRRKAFGAYGFERVVGLMPC